MPRLSAACRSPLDGDSAAARARRRPDGAGARPVGRAGVTQRLQRLARSVGNAAFASSVGNAAFATLPREGAGILSGGAVHPDVEAAIAATRGGGATLDACVRDRLAPELGDALADVRVHTDEHADALSRSISARAFTTGADVFFARGEYRPGTNDGDSLLAHELTHVVQQRGASTTGPLTVTEPGDAFEVEADSVARELAGG